MENKKIGDMSSAISLYIAVGRNGFALLIQLRNRTQMLVVTHSHVVFL